MIKSWMSSLPPPKANLISWNSEDSLVLSFIFIDLVKLDLKFFLKQMFNFVS